MRTVILDISSSALPNVRDFLTPPGDRKAPGNYTKADSIDKWQQEDYQNDLDRAALDLDLARITGACWRVSTEADVHVGLATCQDDEVALIERLSTVLGAYMADCQIVTFGGHNFDLPLLMRRAKYLHVKMAKINITPKWKTPHIDLCDDLCDHNPSRRKSLDFYVRRHQWVDLQPKPMAGAEEAKVFESGDWDRLALSLKRDVEAIRRLWSWWDGRSGQEPVF